MFQLICYFKVNNVRSLFGKNSAEATGLEKVSFHSSLNERQCQRMFKYCIITLISCASKVMLKILQARLQQYVNCEFPDVQAGFRKGRGTRDQIANIRWIIKKAKELQKNIYFCFIDCQSLFVDHHKLGKFWKRWEYQTTLPASWEIYRQVKKQQLELVPNWERSTSRLYFVTLLI